MLLWSSHVGDLTCEMNFGSMSAKHLDRGILTGADDGPIAAAGNDRRSDVDILVVGGVLKGTKKKSLAFHCYDDELHRTCHSA